MIAMEEPSKRISFSILLLQDVLLQIVNEVVYMHLYGQWQPGLRYNTLEHLFAKHDTYPSLYDGGIRRTVRRHGWYNGQTSDGKWAG
jgi:hypothetical protein